MTSFSQEYVAAAVLLIGAVLKTFGVEIPNETVEAVVAGVLALWIAIRRFKRGDIDPLGRKV